jgi:hypothetical protein
LLFASKISNAVPHQQYPHLQLPEQLHVLGNGPAYAISQIIAFLGFGREMVESRDIEFRSISEMLAASAEFLLSKLFQNDEVVIVG